MIIHPTEDCFLISVDPGYILDVTPATIENMLFDSSKSSSQNFQKKLSKTFKCRCSCKFILTVLFLVPLHLAYFLKKMTAYSSASLHNLH